MASLSEENYLKTIFHLNQHNESATTNAIADFMNTKASSVTDMLKKLADKKLINYIKYKGVTLTKTGSYEALYIIRKHRLWEVFLVEKLHFKWDEVHEIAEELEHITSKILIERLESFLDYPQVDPHGDLIPDKNGNFKEIKMIPLSELEIGSNATIVGVCEHSSIFLQLLQKKGLLPGKKIQLLDILEYDQSVTLMLEDKEVTISKDVSKNILIKL